jgi:hypothetical protein
MMDIVLIDTDLRILNSNVPKAENVVSIQLGSLEYAKDFGVDKRYFLTEQFEFQNEAYRSYLLQRLSESSIDVSTVTELISALDAKYSFLILEPANTTSFVR